MSDTPRKGRTRRLLAGGAWSWLEMAVGRNPLIGRLRRFEARIVVASVLSLVVAAIISAGAGAAVYTARVEHYRTEKASFIAVSARATDFSSMPVDSHKQMQEVNACWPALGRLHCDSVDIDHPVSPGAQVQISIDRQGHYVRTPEPTRQAVADASIAAFIVWCALAAVIAAITRAWRSSLARSRDSRMDADLARLLTAGRTRGDRPGP